MESAARVFWYLLKRYRKLTLGTASSEGVHTFGIATDLSADRIVNLLCTAIHRLLQARPCNWGLPRAAMNSNPPSRIRSSNGSGPRIDRDDDVGIRMKSGSSETSYARNSRKQRSTLNAVESVLWESLPSLPRLPDLAAGESSLRIADLGCATGSNTVSSIDKAVAHISELLRSRGVPVPPEVHAFFNDLPANDFNTLFRSFPPYTGPPAAGDRHGRNYFVAGVPGSFHDRLFPSKSIHAFTTFFALHFLTRIPEEVTDRTSPAFNKGHILHDESSVAVRKAFSAEYVRELTLFLTARAQELVSGGLLIAVMVGTQREVESEDKMETRRLLKFVDESARHLVAQGVLDEDAVDTFNVPVRFASLEEVRSAVEACGSFHAHVLESKVVNFFEDLRVQLQPDAKLCGKVYTDILRAVLTPVMEAHFGSQATELLFQRHSLLVEREHAALMEEGLDLTYHLLVLSKK